MRNLPGWLRMVTKGAVIAATVMCMLWSPVMSQDVAVGTASATVLATLTVTATSALAFGNVYQGVAKTVPKNDANAGIFTIAGQPTAQITIYMQMPEYLAGPSNDRMVIAFGTQDINIDTTANANPVTPGAGYQNQNPYNLPTVTLRVLNGTVHMFMGGKVIPSVNQTAGAYSGDIVVTVAYNGT
jgi:hypothetical protein